jgi:hypothetical protein
MVKAKGRSFPMMIARGFKPVGWVAAVGGAALACYMLSLQVAAARADVTHLDRQIVQTEQQIRSLQTELGTRGRLQQLEAWNDDVLALSAPTSSQYVADHASLARFDVRQPQLADQAAEVRLAAAPTPAPAAAIPAPQRAVAPLPAAVAPAPAPVVRRASLTTVAAATPAPAPVRTAAADAQPIAKTASTPAPARARPAATPSRPQSLLSDRTARDLRLAARAEHDRGTAD